MSALLIACYFLIPRIYRIIHRPPYEIVKTEDLSSNFLSLQDIQTAYCKFKQLFLIGEKNAEQKLSNGERHATWTRWKLVPSLGSVGRYAEVHDMWVGIMEWKCWCQGASCHCHAAAPLLIWLGPHCPSHGNEHTELPFPFSPLRSVLAAWWWASEFFCRKGVELCDTCIHWLLLVVIYKVNDLFVFLSGYWMDSPLQVKILYFFFWVSECACLCV